MPQRCYTAVAPEKTTIRAERWKLLNQPPTLASLPVPTRSGAIAGFWRRVLAFAVDAFITALPCGLLGFAFYNFFSRFEAEGILIGFALTLIYFATLGSSVGGGQTIGHRIMHIRVVDREGNFISRKRSVLRYLIFLGPILLTSEVIPASGRFGVKTAIDWLISGAEIAIVYLYLFNRNSRQSLHDLATDTYVVDATSVGKLELPQFWAWHWAILGGAALIGAVLSIGFGSAVGQSAPFPELIAIQQTVLKSGKVRSVGVFAQKNWRNGETSTGLNVIVDWKGKPPFTEKDATEVADIVLRADPQAGDRDFITVKFKEGFTIGFARFSYNRQVSHNPATWAREDQSFGLR